ncbi:protein crumbs, partial [Biomphalaria glabrata]
MVCFNGSPCVETALVAVCDCTPGYTGKQCETNIDDCQVPFAHQCQNNAGCMDGLNNYTCQCLSGWEGPFCEKEKNECESSPCNNGGICSDHFDSFTCSCPVNFTGPTCNTDVDECQGQPSPCYNGASCSNTFGSFMCSCALGYTGQMCESEINECLSQPCYFQGTCVDLINNYRCECLDGFQGMQCETVVRQCVVQNLCGDNGICIDKIEGGYQCFCKPGYYGDHCELIVNLCLSQPCLNGATCTNYGVRYTCSCLPGFSGINCENDIEECASSPCQNNGTCVEPTLNSYQCQCAPGYTGTQCQQDIDDCATKPCRVYQVCIDLVNGFRCECPIGTSGNYCEPNNTSDCRHIPCSNGGTCMSKDNVFVCICPASYTGDFCTSALDICEPSPCQNGGSCIAVNQTMHECVCLVNYSGPNCETLVSDCLKSPCQNGGTCVDVMASSNSSSMSFLNTTESKKDMFVCVCHSNSTGTLCENVVEACSSSPCLNGGNCSSFSSKDYHCDCAVGWEGPTCSENINECLFTSPVCQNNGTCTDQAPGFICKCGSEWTGDQCDEDVVDCQPDTCQNGGTCIEGSGNYTCVCTLGYKGVNCTEEQSQCEPNPCFNDGTCADNTQTSNTNFICSCLPGYTGQLCDGNIDECTILRPCLNNATCLDAVNDYSCVCSIGWTGKNCSVDIDDCLPNLCLNGGTCIDRLGGFTCRCPVGFTNVTCDLEINECSFQPCRNNATCIDLVNSFQCTCQPGYTGVACEVDINECLPSPCAATSTCLDQVNNYTCLCPPGLQGQNCTENIQECSSAPCLYGGECTEVALAMFTCVCLSGVEGQVCQFIRSVTFWGNNSLSFPPSELMPLLVSDSLRIQFTLTTTVLDGILLLVTGVSVTGQPQHVVLELGNNSLYVSGSNGLQSVNSVVVLPSGYIHNYAVLLTIDSFNIAITLTSNTLNTTLGTSVQLTSAAMWILNNAFVCAGVPLWTTYLRSIVRTTAGFTGCFGNLVINNQPINLAVSSQFTQANETTAPTVGCSTHLPCFNTTCLNGGTCIDMWGYKACKCVSGFTGSQCEVQNVASFVEPSMLYFEGDQLLTQVSLEVNFRNTTAGLLVYTIFEDMLSVSVSDGELRIHLASLASSSESVQNVTTIVQHQGWVTVNIQFSANLYVVNVSSPTGMIESYSGVFDHIIRVVEPVFIGRLHSAVDMWRNRNISLPTDMSFQGCLRNVYINQKLLDLSTSTSTPLGNDPPRASAGCPLNEPCVTNPCGNQGTCLSNWTGPTCLCREGYSGQNCSEVSSATFDGYSSYSLVQLDTTKIAFGSEGTLEFRTRLLTSTLMLLQFTGLGGSNSKYIEIRMFEGRLQMYSGFNTVGVESKLNVSDGLWHSVHWVRRLTDLIFFIENETTTLQAEFDIYNQSLASQVNIYIGARPFFI